MVRSSSESSAVAPGRQGGFSEEALAAIERDHAAGVSTQQVVDLFAERGEPLTEATFRKYVQLGLLPRSVRVGRGKSRGSQGLYPATVVRQIEQVRRLMSQGYTMQEIQEEFVSLSSEIDGAVRHLRRALETIERVTKERERSSRADEVIARAIAEARIRAEDLIGRLQHIEQRLAMQARMARAAV